jgi:Bifunctional DNA primase/polymerase, N-terminal/AAA domain
MSQQYPKTIPDSTPNHHQSTGDSAQGRGEVRPHPGEAQMESATIQATQHPKSGGKHSTPLQTLLPISATYHASGGDIPGKVVRDLGPDDDGKRYVMFAPDPEMKAKGFLEGPVLTNQIEPTSTRAAALWYAALGRSVLPLHNIVKGACSCGKGDCASPGKHPRTDHGLKDATTDLQTIRAWWKESPKANVGIVTGAVSGLFALDVDPDKGGSKSLSDLERQHGKLPETKTALTGGDGFHFLFKHPGKKIKNSQSELGSGLDVRGEGGYIVVAPSTHVSGKPYQWRDGAPITDAPDWLLTLVTKPDDKPQQKPAQGEFANWDALRAELGRRIIARGSGKPNKAGNYDCQAICHNGKGKTGLFYNPATNQSYCNQNCDQSQLLRTFSLPTEPITRTNAQGQQTRAATGSYACVRMASIKPEKIDWLWKDYLAIGKITLLDGQPGIGKSWLTCEIAGIVTRGGEFPDGAICKPGKVLMFSAEDGLADTLWWRLKACGADLDKVIALNFLEKDGLAVFNQKGLIRFEETINEHNPSIVIVDPLFAFTGGAVDIHRANECREVSRVLAAIVARQRCNMLCVRHLNKSGGGGDPMKAGIGSIDWLAAARVGLMAGCDPDEKSKLALTIYKSNIGRKGMSFGYRLNFDPVTEEGSFEWTGVSTLSADRICSPVHVESLNDTNERIDAEDFLRELLKTGPIDAAEIEIARKANQIPDYHLRKAKIALGIKPYKLGNQNSNERSKWVWKLPAEGVETAP